MADRTIEIDLSRPVRLAELPALAVAFLEWWLDELASALPRKLRMLLPGGRPSAMLFLGADRWQFRTDDGVETSFDPALDDEARRGVVAVNAGARHRLTALIPAGQALVRRVQLPMITDARVLPTIELQIDRLTPFRTEDVRFACRVVERRIEQNDMSVDVAVVPLRALGEIEQRFAMLGLRPEVIDIADGDQGYGFNLQRAADNLSARRYRMLNVGLAVGAVFVWLMAYYAFGAAGEAEVARWQTRVDEVRPQAQRASALARQIEGMSQPLEIAKAHVSQNALAILNEITKQLPDGARLFELRISDGSIEASGFAQNAPDLIPRLEASKMFAGVRFRAPVTRLPGRTEDRFSLTMTLEGVRK